MKAAAAAAGFVVAVACVSGCRIFAPALSCGDDVTCAAGERCVDGFCSAGANDEGEGEGDLDGEGEGEGDVGEGEGDVVGEGEGDLVGEGEGEANLPPAATAPAGLQTYARTPLLFDVEVSDPDGDVVSVDVVFDHGSATVVGAAVTYVADAGFFGGDAGVVSVDDGAGHVVAVDVVVEVVVAESCRAVLDGGFSTGDGVYDLRDGDVVYATSCDMSDGGFTLAMKVAADDTARFGFNAPLWTDAASVPFGTATTAEDGSAWSLAAKAVPVRRVKVVLVRAGVPGAAEIGVGALNPDGLSLVALLDALETGNGAVSTGPTERRDWVAALQDGGDPLQEPSSLEENCNRHGLSLAGNQRVRIGFQANDENNCDTPDSVIGVGIASPASGDTAVAAGFRGCVGVCPQSGSAGNDANVHPVLKRFALVFVRD